MPTLRLVGALGLALVLACGGSAEPPPAEPAAAPIAAAIPAEVETAAALVAAHPNESMDSCDPSGWPFEALSSLDSAVKESPDAWSSIESDPRLGPLRADRLYMRWAEAAKADLKSTAGIQAFLATHAEWYDTEGVPRDVTFRADGTATSRRSGGEAVELRYAVDGATITLDGASFRVGRSNAGAWLNGKDAGFLKPYPMLCDG